jgi:trehalose-phosphatase
MSSNSAASWGNMLSAESERGLLNFKDFDAAILDLDGVITRTAEVHARAWKATFDAFLAEWPGNGEERQPPFSISADYPVYVDGKPRLDGIRSFLESRRIEIPDGAPGDPPGAPTLQGLARKKNDLFLEYLDESGAGVFEDAVQQVVKWREAGWKTAVVSSSRNCAAILKSSGLDDLFQVRVDGVESSRLKLRGKPAPDIFLEAARRLEVKPKRSFIVEDALAGVRGGKRGGFRLVVGVDRIGDRAGALLEAGAQLAVQSLRELVLCNPPSTAKARRPKTLPSALSLLKDPTEWLGGRRLVLFLDYDGTLTPIVSRPELAVLDPNVRALIERLARQIPVAVISGRDLEDVRNLVGLGSIVYAGSHGFDISGPGDMTMQLEEAARLEPDLEDAAAELERALSDVKGALIEKKRFGVAVHYRNVPRAAVPEVEVSAREALERRPGLIMKSGKMVLELRPRLQWDKGDAVTWLMRRLGLSGPSNLPVFFGDDLTDEDAFRALAGKGTGILVGLPKRRTCATYTLHSPQETARFLAGLARYFEGRGNGQLGTSV